MNTLFSDPLFIGLVVLSVITIVLLCLVIWMYMKLRRFIVGVDSHNVSDSLRHVSLGLDDLQKFKDEMTIYLGNVETRLRKSVQSVHTVRFNPFKGTGGGGNQSFATAFINEEGDGVLISSLYSREHVSVFSKPIKKHSTEHELSDEEKEALDEARKNLK